MTHITHDTMSAVLQKLLSTYSRGDKETFGKLERYPLKRVIYWTLSMMILARWLVCLGAALVHSSTFIA